MAISSILSQISYSYNNIFLLVNFAFRKKKKKNPKRLPPGSATELLVICFFKIYPQKHNSHFPCCFFIDFLNWKSFGQSLYPLALRFAAKTIICWDVRTSRKTSQKSNSPYPDFGESHFMESEDFLCVPDFQPLFFGPIPNSENTLPEPVCLYKLFNCIQRCEVPPPHPPY